MKILAAMVCALLIGASVANAGEFDSIQVGKSKLVLLKNYQVNDETNGTTVEDGNGNVCQIAYLAWEPFVIPAGRAFTVKSAANNTDGLSLNIEVSNFLEVDETAGAQLLCSEGLSLEQVQNLLRKMGMELR